MTLEELAKIERDDFAARTASIKYQMEKMEELKRQPFGTRCGLYRGTTGGLGKERAKFWDSLLRTRGYLGFSRGE